MPRYQPRGGALLLCAAVGLIVTALSGMALVPRVKLVEVMTLVASSVGSGAALAAAIIAFRQR